MLSFVMVIENDVFASSNNLDEKRKTYYVSASGNDRNEGTTAKFSWKTISRVNSQKLNPGDRVMFKGGSTFIGNLELRGNGTVGELIKVCSYGAGKALLKAGDGNGIKVYNGGYVSISNLIIKGDWNSDLQSGNDGFGIIFYNDLPGEVKLGSLNISNCEISGFMKGGISIMSNPGDKSQSGYQQIRIDSNVVHDNGEYGIATIGPVAYNESKSYAFLDIYIRYNKIYNNLGVTKITYTHTGNGLMVSDVDRGLIEYNIVYNNGWKNNGDKGGPCGIWGYDATSLVFQYNESYGNGSGKGKADGDGFDLDGGATNCLMQYNYSHDNFAAGFLIWEYGNTRTNNHGNILRFNISENDNTGNKFYAGVTVGADAGHSVGENLIYNNTIYSAIGSCVSIYSGSSGTQFFNNVFYSGERKTPIIISFTKFCLFLCNNYYNPNGFLVKLDGVYYNSLEDFRNSGNEKYEGKNYGLDIDPNFEGTKNIMSARAPFWLAKYSLKRGSPLIGSALNLLPVLSQQRGTSANVGGPLSAKLDFGAWQSNQQE
jgi:hypothetical protein